MKKVLLTGKPGVGKTTVIKRVVDKMVGRAGGFYTEEIREGGVRKGFRITSLEGQEGVLAHVDFKSPYRVGKYGVNLEDLERVGVAALSRALGECDLIVVDEIARMETFSRRFRQVVLQCLDSDKPLLGTIQKRDDPFLNAIRRRPDVQVIEVTVENREHLPESLLSGLQPGMAERTDG